MKRKMIGRQLSEEEYENVKEGINIHGVIDQEKSEKNIPTMQTGLNSDGTFKEKVVHSQVYDINNKKDDR